MSATTSDSLLSLAAVASVGDASTTLVANMWIGSGLRLLGIRLTMAAEDDAAAVGRLPRAAAGGLGASGVGGDRRKWEGGASEAAEEDD